MNRAFPRATMLLSRRSIDLPRHGEISDCENKSDERFAVLRLSKRKMRKEEKEREREREEKGTSHGHFRPIIPIKRPKRLRSRGLYLISKLKIRTGHIDPRIGADQRARARARNSRCLVGAGVASKARVTRENYPRG